MPRTNEPTFIYLSVINNKIAEKIGDTTDKAGALLNMPEGANNCREFFDDEGKYVKTIYEYITDTISGVLIDIKYDDKGEFGAVWKLIISDHENTYQLQIPEKSSRAVQLWKKFKSLDPTIPIKFKPYGKKKEYSGWNILQNNEEVPWFITPERPDGYPPLPEGLAGKDYDKYTSDEKDEYKIMQTQRRKFFRKYVFDELLPLLGDVDEQLEFAKKAYSKESNKTTEFDDHKSEEPTKQSQPNIHPEPEDDLPF